MSLGCVRQEAMSPMARQPTDPPPFAPWTWSTLQISRLTEAVQAGLGNHGIGPELCSVGVRSAE